MVPISSLPSGIAPDAPFITANNELLIGSLTPEFTIYGIPIQSSSNSFQFTFPNIQASSAKILASGLGVGSHVAQDTELIGIIMTSLFNLVIPAALIGLGVASNVDAFVKQVAAPLALLVAQEIATGVPDGTAAQATAIFWRAFVKGAVGKAMTKLITAFVDFLTEFEVFDIAEDSIPIAGEIIQAIGVLGTYAEIAETTIEVMSSPWTYVNNLVGTYNLSITLNPQDQSGFPATAATYTISAVFDGGTPHLQTLRMPSTNVKTLPPIIFNAVPLGGMVTVTVGFYAQDGTHVAHGTTGSIPNLPPSSSPAASSAPPSITVANVQFPITASTKYQHQQKTVLDASGNHAWLCTLVPPSLTAAANCDPSSGNICHYRGIEYNTTFGAVGYGWQSYTKSVCDPNIIAQLDNLAALPNAGTSIQQEYATVPCPMTGGAKLVYDPLGRADLNFYLDTTSNKNLLRQVTLNPIQFASPQGNTAWGRFASSADDLVLHPSGTVVSINQSVNRLESIALPAQSTTDDLATQNLQSTLHGGLGSRPGLFSQPVAATVTADGVILVLENGNNRIHAVDVSANPVRYFSRQGTPYFLNLTETGGPNTQYLDIACDFSGLVYVLSISNGAYRLDIYPNNSVRTTPLATTMNVNVAKIAVDYWRNLYSLNYEVLMQNGGLPSNGVTEPSVSQWLPTTPRQCSAPPQSLSNAGVLLP